VSKTTAAGVQERESAPPDEEIGKVVLPDMSLLPALLSRYRDLAKLRYDYPVVLVAGESTRQIQSLKSVVNALLQEIAPSGVPGERMRRILLRLETEVRRNVANGARGRLTELWDRASREMIDGAEGALRESLEETLRRARTALEVDGELIDCDAETPVRIVTHIWRQAAQVRAGIAIERITQLELKLSQILEAVFVNSEEGQAPDHLKAMVGPGFDDSFDFATLSRTLDDALPHRSLPEARRQRIERTLEVLRSQRFFPVTNKAEEPHSFSFESLTDAMSAWEERVGEMVELVKAIQIAELEVENRYREAKHDTWFAQFGTGYLSDTDFALFPSYLVILDESHFDDMEKSRLIEVLSSNRPFKILMKSESFFAGTLASEPVDFTGWRLQLGVLAASLGTAGVVQAATSALCQVAGDLQETMTWRGPAVVNTYIGSYSNSIGLPNYLTAAVATQSRVFPTFSYLPMSGSELADRFRISANVQPESPWPINGFSWHDKDLQVTETELPFTPAEFLACDRRWSGSFARIPESVPEESLCTLADWLALDEESSRQRFPFIWMVDAENHLHRVLVREKVLAIVRRIGGNWRNLQELGGSRNSYAMRLLDRERRAWEEAKQEEIDEIRAALGAETAAAVAEPEALAEAVPAGVAEPAAPAPPSDEPWIETPRCTTCNECTNRNNRMFAYNKDKQAYIKDATAGTYREMIEAAETCQVAIIHPGKPKDPEEPGLEELIKRAEPFQK
jgi:hypothetical protein